MTFKNIIKLLYNRINRLVEFFKLIFINPDDKITFYIVSPCYNSNIQTLKCLDSIYNQKFNKNRVKHIVIDDCSTDNTKELICKWLDDHPDNSVTFIENKTRQGLCANNYYAFKKAPDKSVIVMLDGDDYLSDNNVLRYLAKIYSQPNIWITYNTWISSTRKIIGSTRKISTHTIMTNSFRTSPWTTSHLKTFKAELFKYIPKEYLIDPETSTWWEKSSDQAFFLSLLELAGSHIYHCKKICYIYYIGEHTKNNKHKETQENCKLRISQLRPLSPLTDYNDNKIKYNLANYLN